MATLFLMCGLPGSGKTTLARSIERERDAWWKFFEPPTEEELRPRSERA